MIWTVIASGLLQAQQQRRAGQIAKAQSKIDAAAEGDAGREREIGRKEALQRALSSQLAEAGAAGIAFSEGSPAAMANLDIQDMVGDNLTDSVNTRTKQRALILQGNNAAKAGSTAAALTLLDTAGKASDIGFEGAFSNPFKK